MMNVNNITFIGPVSPPLNGPGVKNKIIVDEFKKRNIRVFTLNTLGLKNRLVSLINTLKLLTSKSDIILSASKNGRYFYVPLLAFVNWLQPNKNMVLLPAGGFLNEEIQNLKAPFKSLFVKGLKRFNKIYPENRILYEELEKLGFEELEILPNPRVKREYEKKHFDSERIEVYFVSSIKESKGILDAIEAVDKLKKKGYNIRLNIYGRVNVDFDEQFHNAVSKSAGSIYHGLLPNEEVVQTLASKADILVLPTYYFGEGLPGILVEAAIAKTPVVITNFRGIDAYFKNEKNALFVNKKAPDDIAKKIERIISDEALRHKITEGIADLSDEFDVKNIVNRLLKEIE